MQPTTGTSTSPVRATILVLRRELLNIAAFSGAINLLLLVSPLYMLQVYDRVLTSKSSDTLLYLTLFVLVALATLGLLEWVRSRLLVRVGAVFDASTSDEVFAATVGGNARGSLFRDLESLRAFLSGNAILALLDAPWVPVFLIFSYVLHPAFGNLAVVGAIALFALGFANELTSRRPLAEAGQAMMAGTVFAEASARNAEVVRAMGMLPNLRRAWPLRYLNGLLMQARTSDRAGSYAAAARFVRIGLQSAVLGLGAWLVLKEQISSGSMIASSILIGRALAPVEQAIASWRQFIGARLAYARLSSALASPRDVPAPQSLRLPNPAGAVEAENLVWGPASGERQIIRGVSVRIDAGQSLGIIGPSAAGKSTLLRLLIGVHQPLRGTVRLDKANLADWPREQLGPHVGYLPQDIELFAGTVAENICRFGNLESERVLAAAALVDAHSMILQLPQGYDTRLGHGGNELSGGQRQRIGLARAVYGTPALIVLDEPTSHLDAEGEAAVVRAMEALKKHGRTVVIVAHRPSLMGGIDHLLVLQNGLVAGHGPTPEIMPALTRRDIVRQGAAHG